MEIQLIQGEFPCNEAIELIAQLIQTKIKYHENKIEQNLSEEDIKFRETKIKQFQNKLFELRNEISFQNRNVRMKAVLEID